MDNDVVDQQHKIKQKSDHLRKWMSSSRCFTCQNILTKSIQNLLQQYTKQCKHIYLPRLSETTSFK